MAITLAPDTVEDSDTDDSFTSESLEDGSTEYTIRELLDEIYAKREVILTIPTDQVALLRQGLIARKAKDNGKLKKADLATSQEVLSFLVYPAKDEDGKELVGDSCVRIKIGPKRSITVKKMEVPNNEF